MTEVVEVELVVGGWPLRSGVSVYEPLTGAGIAAWDLGELAAEPHMLKGYADVLNPARPYRKRAQATLDVLADEQQLLREVLGVPDGEDVQVVPVLSDDVERELGDFAACHELKLRDFALPAVPQLLAHLRSLDVADHHAFLLDWWKRFEARPGAESPLLAGPDAQLYHAAFGPEHALGAWQADQDASAATFSLWTALRVHWAWRVEFADQPEPRLKALGELRRMFR